LSNLDAQLRIQMRREIIRLQRQLQITTIYVTHDQVEAMTMGDRIVVMRDGLVQQAGDPMTIYNYPANQFVARFIGNPPMNLFNGRLESHNGEIRLQTDFADYTLPSELQKRLASKQTFSAGTQVVCGIRAEDVSIDLNPIELNQGQSNYAQGIVDLIEPLGSDVYVSLAMGTQMLLARSSPDLTLQEAQKTSVNLNLSKMHFFDPASGLNLLATT
jgi:multiple sugar transport system ATP-binding protein